MARLGFDASSTRPAQLQFLDWTQTVVGSGVGLSVRSQAGINSPFAQFSGTGSGSGGGQYFSFVPSSTPSKIVFRITCEWERLFVAGSTAALVSFRNTAGSTVYYEFSGLTAGQRSLTIRDTTTSTFPFSSGVGYDRGTLCTFWGVWKKASAAGANDGYAALVGHVASRNVVRQNLDNEDHDIGQIRVGYVSAGTNLNGKFNIHEFEMWDEFPHDDLSLINASAGVKYFDQCPSVVRIDGAVPGQTPSNLSVSVNGGVAAPIILSSAFGVRTNGAGTSDALQFEHLLVDDATFNVPDNSYDGYLVKGSDGPSADLPIGQVFWQRGDSGFHQCYVGSTCYMAVNPPVKVGTLTTRTSDTAGTLTMETGHGIASFTLNQTFYWVENGLLKSRRNTTIGTVSGDSVPFSGGTGDVLPSTSTVMYHGYQVSDYRAGPTVYQISNWLEVSPGSYIFGLPASAIAEGQCVVSAVIGGVPHEKTIQVRPFRNLTLRSPSLFPKGRYFAFGFDDSPISMSAAWHDCFGKRSEKPYLAVIVGTSGVTNQLSWEALRLLARDGWYHCSHLWNSNALGTMTKAIGLKLVDICNQILRLQGYDNAFFVAPQGQTFSTDDPNIVDELMERLLAIRLSATSPVNNFPINYSQTRGESVTNVTASGANATEEALNWWTARLASPVAAETNAYMIAQGHEISDTESASFTSVDLINAYIDVAVSLGIKPISFGDTFYATGWPNAPKFRENLRPWRGRV